MATLDPITLVCGFGRCGSSLVMQMLAAGGMPMTGGFPTYEDDRASPNRADLSWLPTEAGRAVKLLDPQRFSIPAGPVYRVIWCSRDHEEQARSQAKFARLLLGVPAGRRHIKAFAKSYINDHPKALRSLNEAGCAGLLTVRFETTLARPHEVAAEIAAHCAHRRLDTAAMAAAVRPRHPACAPGLDMELALISEHENSVATGA